ncbi:DUF4349 domain-containing protein [archaeon]|nr:DUF4349 domain-containing protein [archaeon]
MAIKDQLNKLKENWLLILLVFVVFVFMSGGLNMFSGSMNYAMDSYKSGGYAESMVADMGYQRGGYYPNPGYNEDFAPEVEERVVTKTSSMSTEIERGKYYSSEAVLKSIVTASRGFILNENVNQHDEGWKAYSSGYYTIKVPTNDYSNVLAQLKEIGEVKSFNENAQDVTGRYTDLNTQLETERSRLERYEQMYAEATEIEDKINLNDRIFNQERTIKYLEDAINNIDSRVDYSQISFRMTEKRSNYANIYFVKFYKLVDNLVDSTSSLLRFAFTIFPWAVVYLLGRVVYLRVKRRQN